MYSSTNVPWICEITTAQMMTVQEIIVSQSQAMGKSSTLLHFALDTEPGPCGFLTLLPVLGGEPYNVSVIHTLRKCHLCPGVYAFIGDTQPPRLPTIKMEPSNGLDLYFEPFYKSYCDRLQVDSFYRSNPDCQVQANKSREEWEV
jgi:hypothetical protein